MAKIRNKILIIALAVFIGLSAVPASAATNGTYPKLIIDSYIVEGDALVPGSTSTITINILNTNNTRSVRNVRLSFSDSTNEIIPVDTASAFFSYIEIGEICTWEFEVYAVETSEDKPHTLNITMEYEDTRSNVLQSEDVIIVDVVQPVKLSYTQPDFPQKVTEGDTFSFSMDLMNTGKTDIYNALLTFDIENITSGSSLLVGTVKEGGTEEAKTNFRVDTEITGDSAGTITLTYEDSRGREYEESFEISTFIQKKAIVVSQTEDDTSETLAEDLKKWKIAFYACGGLSVILLITVIVTIIRCRKIKSEYEMKL